MSHESWMKEALALARQNMGSQDGGPFGAVVVYEKKIIGRGSNRVLIDCDPTAHGEIIAIREACLHLGNPHLNKAILYTSCEPCPMCLTAALWARIETIYFAATREDAAKIGFDDAVFYEVFEKQESRHLIQRQSLMTSEGKAIFEDWKKMGNRLIY